MRITYKEMNEDLDAVIKAREKDPLERYEAEITGELKVPGAMKVLQMLDSERSFEARAAFVKDMLTGCHVSIFKDGKKSFDVGFTNGMEWWAVDGFNADPLALRYLVTCVYTRFLKKFTA